MSDRPPFDPQRAAFWLVAFVIAVECLVAVAGGVTCVVYADFIIKDPNVQCDPQGRLFQILSGALAAALAMANIRKS